MKKLFCAVMAILLIFAGCLKPDSEPKAPDKPSGVESETIPDGGNAQPDEHSTQGVSSIGLLYYDIVELNPFDGIEITGEPIVWAKGRPLICIYDSEKQGYGVTEYSGDDIKTDIDGLVSLVISHLDDNVDQSGLDISVRVEKSMVIVDFGNTESFNNAFGESKACEELLNSLAMTLTKIADIYDVGFTMSGGRFTSSFVTLENDGYGRYIPPQLYGDISEEEFKTLRSLCTYSEDWANSLPAYYSYENLLSVVYDPAVTLRPEGLDILLAYAGRTGPFVSPEEIDDSVKILCALKALDFVDCFSIYDEGSVYAPHVEAIYSAVLDSFIPKEWVENVVKRLFGPDAAAEHMSVSKYGYSEKVGVYTPQHIGGWAAYFPYVFSVSETESGYEAEVAYLYTGGFSYGAEPGVWESDISYDCKHLEDDPKAMDFIKNGLPRYIVQVKRAENGSLYLASSEKIIEDMTEENRALAAKYIAPIHHLATGEPWFSTDMISAKDLYFTYFEMAEHIYFGKADLPAYYGISAPSKTFEADEEIDRDKFESTLSLHFDTDLEGLRKEYLDEETGNYRYPSYVGFGDDLFPVVTRAKETDGELIILYDIVGRTGNFVGSRRLIIALSEDGRDNWKYKYCYEN